MEAIDIEIEKLHPENGDIVVVTAQCHPSVISHMAHILRETTQKDITLIVLLPGQTIQVLDEQEMNNLGWYHQEVTHHEHSH